ncbi:lipid-binding SYLF domain-containing protein [Salinimicrobium catena]|uniref:lipid-binding SYLF domain-containing protein n=1 Tax=Salinimicrobium catena TaxID=390640 RepID=UPI002FE4EAA9
MKKNLNKLTALFALMLFLSSGAVMAQDYDKKDKNKDKEKEQIVDQDKKKQLQMDAKEAKAAFMKANAELEGTLSNAAGYAIFPNVGKGAWILGGGAGNGIVYENDQLVGYAELRQIDIGFQFGGKAFRELIVFQTQEALDKFKEGNFEFGGSASAVIWDKGKGEAITFENGVGVAIMPKAGAMVGISVGGQEFDYRAAQ